MMFAPAPKLKYYRHLELLRATEFRNSEVPNKSASFVLLCFSGGRTFCCFTVLNFNEQNRTLFLLILMLGPCSRTVG
jgi:hypothetical protein